MRKTICALVGVGLLLTAGCATTGAPDVAAASHTSVPSSTPTPTPAASPVPTSEPPTNWTPVVAQAALKLTDFDGASSKDATFESVFDVPCGVALTPVRRADVAYRYTNKKDAAFFYAVAAYDPQPGTVVVDEMRAAMKKCTTWKTPGDELSVTDQAEVTIKRPAGIDNAFAFCVQYTFLVRAQAGQKFYVCAAVFSRGHLVAQISLQDKSRSIVQKALVAIAPWDAIGLLRAVPTA